MKFIFPALIISTALIFSGCKAKEQSEPVTTDGWDTPPQGSSSATAPAADATSSATASPAGGSPDVEEALAVVKGINFSIEGSTETIHSGEDLHMSHYFYATAPFELKTSATTMVTKINGHTTNGASPLVGFRVTSTSGAYQDHGYQPRPVDGEQTLNDPMPLPAGTYMLTVSYYEDTGNGVRPAVSVKQISFK